MPPPGARFGLLGEVARTTGRCAAPRQSIEWTARRRCRSGAPEQRPGGADDATHRSGRSRCFWPLRDRPRRRASGHCVADAACRRRRRARRRCWSVGPNDAAAVHLIYAGLGAPWAAGGHCPVVVSVIICVMITAEMTTAWAAPRRPSWPETAAHGACLTAECHRSEAPRATRAARRQRGVISCSAAGWRPESTRPGACAVHRNVAPGPPPTEDEQRVARAGRRAG